MLRKIHKFGLWGAGFFWPSCPRPSLPAAARTMFPHYKNDPSWPKPFAHHWVMGQIGGLAVDRHDRIWVLQRALAYSVDEQGKKHDLARADGCRP